METKPAWFYRQSAAIPVRHGTTGLEVLLVSSRGGKRWVIPKGIVEPGMTPADSAAKEAWEEGGVRGLMHPQSVGSYSYRKWGGTCSVEVFLLEVRESGEEWPEPERRRSWVSLDAAVGMVEEAALRALITQVPGLLAGRGAKP